jgi:hypothetical protein
VQGSISCIEASFDNADPFIGQIKHCECKAFIITDMSYEIHPANILATTEFDAFSATTPVLTPPCIIQYKFTFDTANPTALALLYKEATPTNIGILSAFALTDTADKVKIGFAFGVTEHHNLVGDHDMTLAVSLKDYPSFDYFMKVEFKFKLKITSACTTTKFGEIGSGLKPFNLEYSIKDWCKKCDKE